jgi:Ribbon-helix-helix protein, copG family.
MLLPVLHFITDHFKVNIMREILTISVDKALKTKVERAAKRLKVSKSELVKKAIEKYIVKEEFRELRALLIPYAEKAGYFTDEDVFKDIS